MMTPILSRAQPVRRDPPPTGPGWGRLVPAALAGSAAAMAALAVWNHRQAEAAEQRHPPLGRFIEAGGVRLHHAAWGRGQPLVVLHGNGSLMQDFLISGLVDRAAGRYRVILFDRPGFGYSERPRTRLWTPDAQAEAIAAALGRLEAGPAVVLGHSWGTLVALALALNHPDAVSALVLVSGYYYPRARADVLLFAPPGLPGLGDALRYTIAPALGRALAPAVIRRIFEPCPVPDSFAAFPLDLALRPSQLRALGADSALMIPGAAALSARYRDLRQPAVILSGSEDRIVDVASQAERLHAELHQSELVLVSGAGHMVHHIAPERVMAAIDAAAARGRAAAAA